MRKIGFQKQLRLMAAGLVSLFVLGAFSPSEAQASGSRRVVHKAAFKKAPVKKTEPVKRAPVAAQVKPTFSQLTRQAYALSTYSCVIDGDSCHSLPQAAQRENAILPPASLAKIMTAALIYENMKARQKDWRDAFGVVTKNDRAQGVLGERDGVVQNMRGGVLFKDPVGQPRTYDEFLKALAVKSANDFAVAAARELSGSEAAFASSMTARAVSWGAGHTVFKNASGMPATGQVTTAADMAQILFQVRKMMGERDFARIFGQKEAVVGRVEIQTHIPEIRRGVLKAAKTGTINGLANIAGLAPQGDRLVVVMGASSAAQRSDQVLKLLQVAFDRSAARKTAEAPSYNAPPAPFAQADAQSTLERAPPSRPAVSGPTIMAAAH